MKDSERTPQLLNSKVTPPRGNVRQGAMQNTKADSNGGPKPTVVQISSPSKRGS